MAALLALASALFYGAADFMGGFAARAASTIAVVVVSQCAGLLVLGVLLPILPASPGAGDLTWGIAAGVFGGTGVALLYRALAVGTMGIVAPTTAVCAVVVPVIVGIVLGERPGTATAAGIALALVAIVLVSQQPTGSVASRGAAGAWPPGVGLALLSGVAIGFFFLSLAQTGTDAGLWPLLVARAASVAIFGGIALAGAGLRLPARAAGIAVTGGILDMVANAFYLIAVRQGPLTAVVTLSSLYPAATVVLARLVLRERLNAIQLAGIVTALVAVALIVS